MKKAMKNTISTAKDKETCPNQNTAQMLTPEDKLSQYYDFMKRKEADSRASRKLMWYECQKQR